MNKTTPVLATKINCEPGSPTYDKLWYGTYVFYLNAVKMLILVAIALILGVLPYVAVFALAYGALRSYSFGVHLDNSLLCMLVGLVYYLGSIYLSLYMEIPTIVKVATILICAVGFVLYAPAQTRKRPIPEHQQKVLKKKSLGMFAVVTVSVFALHPLPVFSNLVFMAVVCQTINLLPITYKIFKECV